LWSTTGDDDQPLDKTYGFGDLAAETIRSMIRDCDAFQNEAGDMIADDLGRAGHDFWLTRNRHGAGFWDGDWGENGETLTAMAHAYGEVEIYVGDDDQIYSTGTGFRANPHDEDDEDDDDEEDDEEDDAADLAYGDE
jgi:hypothetical protein